MKSTPKKTIDENEKISYLLISLYQGADMLYLKPDLIISDIGQRRIYTFLRDLMKKIKKMVTEKKKTKTF